MFSECKQLNVTAKSTFRLTVVTCTVVSMISIVKKKEILKFHTYIIQLRFAVAFLRLE